MKHSIDHMEELCKILSLRSLKTIKNSDLMDLTIRKVPLATKGG